MAHAAYEQNSVRSISKEDNNPVISRFQDPEAYCCRNDWPMDWEFGDAADSYAEMSL